jgi:prophage antirepressor-like protein
MLTQFQFESQEIRFINGKPVANDVALVLGYTNPRDAVYRLVKDKNKSVCKTQTLRYGENKPRIEDITVLEEAGIYQLIFSSKLPIAEKFQDWIFEEVLPSIRKTGSYSIIAQPQRKLPVHHYADRVMLLDKNLKKPPNTWCVIEKCAHLLLKVEKLGYEINPFDLMDGSVGRQYSTYRKGKEWLGQVFTAEYTFADERGTKFINAFEYCELGYFSQWLDTIYEPSKLPTYLKGKYTALVHVS